MKIKSEDHVDYSIKADSDGRDDRIIADAMAILVSRLAEPGKAITSTETVKDYLKLHFAEKQREEFIALWLDTPYRVIAIETLATGTIDGASVYPREVAKSALAWNAAAVIFAHNHPSGVAEPSKADNSLTQQLTKALGLLGIKVLDHIVIGGVNSVSLAERGLM